MSEYHPAIVDREVTLLNQAFSAICETMPTEKLDPEDSLAYLAGVQARVLEVISRVDWLLCHGDSCLTATSRAALVDLKAQMARMVINRFTI